MYKLEFTLKQHTPIIHFQHEQEGATLRATEVKPKLDRFILIKLGEQMLNNPEATLEERYQKGIVRAKEKKWLVGSGDHASLNYKIRIDEVKPKNTNIINQIELIERPKLDRRRNVIKKIMEKLIISNILLFLEIWEMKEMKLRSFQLLIKYGSQ